MKRFLYVLILLVIFVGVQCFAEVVTERKINRTPQEKNIIPVSKPAEKTFSSSLKTCKPYTETMKSDYLGMNVNYKISISGWINNKCRLDFVAETSGISSSFEGLYGVDPSEVSVSAFVPKIRCEFTKQQLEYVGDSILQEEERNAGATNNMLKDPNNINLPNITSLSGSDAKLMSVVLGSNACQIVNGGELNNMIQNLMGY